ncbi:sorbitol dehydrogenase [Bacillus timonensis]|uniref:Sorbitol dehydrogenase n=1 Tax=Bacillus timonensis TaxID=1033734 RepID=A0A4S3PN14_9BACI|nr:alcohol dehydrogenase catalytic domain-containing protein [Bacillus timonensis]THE10505.1 sorbitol dehydrogenase [Bacillus timonensis]
MLELYVKKPFELELREVESIESPKKGEVKIRVSYGGICGSDLSLLQGKFAHGKYPIRPGHELVGTIIECGEASDYEVGTRVVILPNTYCEECEMCRSGRTNICRNKKSLGINMDGGFSEEYVISTKLILPIPDDLSDEKAVLIEPFAVVVSGFNKVTIKKGHDVAVVGSGSIGMLAAALARHLGANVTAIDINPKKLEMVKKIGDIRTLNPQEITEDDRFDIVIEAAGVKASVEHSFQILKPGGSMLALGIAPEVTIPFTQLVRNDQSIHGSIIYNFPDDYLKTIEYLRSPDLNVAPIVSKVVPLADYQQAYDNALSEDFGKILIKF